MVRRCLLLLVAPVIMCSPALARANIAFAFTTDKTNYTIQAGQSASVMLTLVQTGTFALSSENGLQSLNFVVLRDSAPSVSPSPARIDTTNSTINSAQFGSVFTGSATESDLDLTLMRPFGNTSGPSGTVISLATLIINAGTTAGQTRFHVLDNPDFDEDLTYGNTVLDSFISQADFSVTVVTPEPTLIGLFAIAGVALTRRKNGRDRKSFDSYTPAERSAR